MSADWKKAKDTAKKVREQYTLNGGSVNAFDIAQKEGINIAYFRPELGSKIANASGLFNAEEKTIYLNADESAERQNFTLAHELAHYFLGHKPGEHGVYWRNATYTQGEKPSAEQEADCFASELLMPKSLIDHYRKIYHLSDTDVTALSKLLGVSTAALKYRLLDIKNGKAT